MPGMDGETLGRTIKADPVLKDTQLIMLTSMGQRGDAKRFKAIGFSAYLTKPVRSSQLKETLTAVWGAKSQDISTDLVTKHSLAESRTLVTADTKETDQGKGARVLVAEDNIVNKKVAVKMLEKLGCRVNVTANGKEAVDMLESFPYDLVFMDCQMPEMDGYEATAAIRKWEEENRYSETENRKPKSEKRIPIIAITANAMKGDREKCLEAGMDDYISKPVDVKKLAQALGKWAATLRQEKEPSEEAVKIVDDFARD